MAAELRTRRPTGEATWPRVLISGEDGTEAAWMAAELSADERLATTYWLQVGGGDGPDIYAAAPGASYEILVHDGTWLGICEQLAAALAVAVDAGVPSGLVINSMTPAWAMQQDAIDRRARRREGNGLVSRGLDPAPAYASEMEVSLLGDQWWLVNRRHDQFMDMVAAWPGPVVMTARDKVTADGRRYTKAHETLGQDCSAWIRLTRDDDPEIIKLNTALYRYADKEQRAALRAEFTLPRLIWEWSRCTADSRAPEVVVLDADQVMPGEQAPPRPTLPGDPRKTAPRPAAIATPAPASATPTPASTVEGVRAVANLVKELVTLADRGRVSEMWERSQSGEFDAVPESANVSGLLRETERERLEIPEGKPYSLKRLGTDVCRLVNVTGQALRPDLEES